MGIFKEFGIVVVDEDDDANEDEDEDDDDDVLTFNAQVA